MPETVGEAFVAIRPDTKGFAGETERGIAKPLLGIASAVGGAFAAIGLGKFIGDTIQQAQESATVVAQTNAVIKSTGEVAKVSAGDVDDLAKILSELSGVDDEVIASGENVLLTFTNVRNELGEGNDIFNQATGLALDMSRALGTDLQGAVIQLGKALNDPIAGITALSRVGVSFTEDQKNQIQGFIDANDLLSAQKVILQELAKEFGGAAEAAATPIDKLKVAIGNAKQEIGAGLLPVVSTLVDKLLPVLPQITDTLAGAVGGLAAPIADVVTALAPFLKSFVDVFAPVLSIAGQAISALVGALEKGLTPILEALGPILSDVAFFIGVFFHELDKQDVLSQLGNAIGGILTALRPLAKVFGELLVALAPVIAALGKAFVHVLQALTPLIPPIVRLIGALAPILTKLATALAPIIDQIGRTLAEAIEKIAPSLPQLVDAFINLLKAVEPLIPVIIQITTLWIQLLPPLAELIAVLVGPLSEAINVVAGAITFLTTQWGEKWEAIKAAAGAAVEFLDGVWHSIEGALGEVVDFFTTAFGDIVRFFQELPDNAINALGDFGGRIVGFFTGALSGVFLAVQNSLGDVVTLFAALPTIIINALGDLATTMFNLGVQLLQSLIDGAKSLLGKVGNFFEDTGKSIAKELTFGLLGSPWLFTRDIGRDLMTDLMQGMTDQRATLTRFLDGLTSDIQNAVTPTGRVSLTPAFAGTAPGATPSPAAVAAAGVIPASSDTFNIYAPHTPDPLWLAVETARRRRVASIVVG